MRWEHFNVWQKCKMNYHYFKRKKESLWKIERERLKWHLAHKSIIGNNNWLTAYDIHMYIYYTGQLMTVFSNNYINYIFFYLWKILFFGPLENSNLFNLHGKITGPQHTYTNFQKLSKRILDPLLLINSDYLLMDLLTIKNRPWVKDSSINCTSNHKIVTKSDLFYNVKFVRLMYTRTLRKMSYTMQVCVLWWTSSHRKPRPKMSDPLPSRREVCGIRTVAWDECDRGNHVSGSNIATNPDRHVLLL